MKKEKIIKKRFKVSGMTCINCQNKIENKFKDTVGIDSVKVSYTTGICNISYDPELINEKDIYNIVEKLDYKVVKEHEKEKENTYKIVGYFVVIIGLYALLEHLGILNLLVPSQLADTKMGYGMLFFIGLITSVHCIAMCGGINLSQCIPKETLQQNESKLSTFLPALWYNVGRVVSYTVIGFILGGIGRLLGGDSTVGLSMFFQGIMKLIAGIFMVIMGINMLAIIPWLRKYNLAVPKFIAIRINKGKANSNQPLIVGLLNGLMPCGPLQSMQIVALASGNPFVGGFSMFLFSLGTVPLMLGLGSLVAVLGKKFTKKMMSVGAILVVVLGFAMISQGGSLSGLFTTNTLFIVIIVLSLIAIIGSIPVKHKSYQKLAICSIIATTCFIFYISKQWESTESDSVQSNQVSSGTQVINSTLSAAKYPNITVQAGVPVKWVIDAAQGSINGCNYRMQIREYGIQHSFDVGENVIEFTPTKAGTYKYSCWMGMIRGTITVVDGDISSTEDNSNDTKRPAGYKIPTDTVAIAEHREDNYEGEVQIVSIKLTDKGFSPAIVVVQSDMTTIWNVYNQRTNEEQQLLVPFYATALPLEAGENPIYMMPEDSFEAYTDDNSFYVYVKVVDDIEEIDVDAIKNEVGQFETIIYPKSMFQ